MVGNITGMILDLPEKEILETLDNSSKLSSRVQEALCQMFEHLNISSSDFLKAIKKKQKFKS